MLKSQIEKAFPGRTPKSVRMLIHRLKKAGRIEKRKAGPRGKRTQSLKELRISSKPEKVFKTPEEETEKVEGGPCRPFQPLETRPHELADLLRQIKDALVTCTWHFEHHCRNCKESGIAEDNKVWKWCPKCGEDLIVWNVEASK